MFWLISVITVAIPIGYIFDCLPIAFVLIILFALIGLPIIARMEVEK